MTKKLNHLQRTRRDHSLWDERINNQWNGAKPILSEAESLLAARKLYRHAMGKAWPHKWATTSGNRYTWPKGRTFYVNPERKRYGRYPVENVGLRDIIHLIAHYCHRRLHPGDKPHSIRQLRLEARLTKFAISRGWANGLGIPEKAPAEKPKIDKIVQRYRAMVNRREKWKREADRAARLLAKAESEVRTYERRHGDRLAA